MRGAGGSAEHGRGDRAGCHQLAGAGQEPAAVQLISHDACLPCRLMT
jgi:hypothetical protein